MSEEFCQRWANEIARWAATKSQIAEVFLYGSRVKGTARDDSDLDVAIRIEATDETSLTTWVFEGREWAEELDDLLDVEVHLEMLDGSDRVVLPAVREHGLRIYSKPVT